MDHSTTSKVETAANAVSLLKEKEREKEEVKFYPRPSEIPFQPKVANSVNLVGYVQKPVQLQASPDGKYWAGTILAQGARTTSDSDSPPLWIPLIFEGNLAHTAACHLREDDYICVAGQLSGEPPPVTINQGQAKVQVMVHNIHFVEKSSVPKKNSSFLERLSFNNSGVEDDNSFVHPKKDDDTVTQSWEKLLTQPHEWWDFRLRKGSAASFEHKVNGQLLRIDESTPECILEKIELLSFDHKINEKNEKTATSMTNDQDPSSGVWRALVNDPKLWWDFRQNKLDGLVNPRHPDFKRKDDGLSLWLNKAPKWVLSKLKGLEFDVKIPKTKQVKEEGKGDKSWKNLVEKPNEWWDNRLNKKGRSPDFRHKETKEGLWLSDSPAWVLSKLPPVKNENASTRRDTLLS